MEVVRYDARGTGISDRVPEAFGRECLLLDIEAVRHSVGLERFVLFGHMNGCISAIEYAAAYPERVEALVLVSPWLNGRTHLALSEHFGLQPLAGMSERQWEGFTDTVAMHALGGGVTDASRKLGRVYRDAMTPDAYLAFLEWRRTIDLTEAARSVTAPTLVIRRESTLRYPSDLDVARTIPNAHLVTIPPREGPFQAWHDSETEAIEDFLAIPPVTAVVEEHQPVSIRTKMEAAGLTHRELQVLKLIAEGRSSQEMARALTLSEHTIARHIANIYRKTGAHGRVEAADYARRYGIA
jgi:pimeloyl-ACP methyl ester carboxylesterase/DNA-binding CsgD family transcriptional regulator